MNMCSSWRSGLGAALALLVALLACIAAMDALAAPLPSQLGPEVAMTRPRDGYVGRLNVSPEHGPAGTPVTVTAEELPPNQEIPARLAHREGNWKVDDAEYHGRDFKPVAYEIAKVKSDHAGRLTAQVHRRRRISASCTTSCCSRATACSPRSAFRST